MKYSIRGNFVLEDGSDVVSILNKYPLWRLVTGQERNEDENILFNFEVWLNTELDKTNLFNELKPFVDKYGETIDWHICSHDESTAFPCEIIEKYVNININEKEK